jgi:hypothetical protein
MKKITFLLSLFFVIGVAAQNSKMTVGVMAFQSSSAQYKARAAQLQEIVMEALSSKSNIEALDRSKDDLLNKELDAQIDERYIASKQLVEQGKKSGAQHLVVGTLTSCEVSEQKKANGPSFGPYGAVGKTIANSVTNYRANLSFSMQIIDVETGKVISHKAFNQSKDNFSAPGMGNSKEDAVVSAMKNSKEKILLWLNETYPSTITIVKVEEKTGSGKPKTILITGIDESYNKGDKLLLEETELIPSGSSAPPLKRIKSIATITIVEKQGDFTVCKVNDGAEMIEERVGKTGTLSIKNK